MLFFFLLCEWDEGVVCSFFPEMRVLGIRLMLLEEKQKKIIALQMDLIIGLQRRRVTCCVLCILWVVCTKGASYQGFRGMPIHPKAILYLLVLMTRPQF